MNRLYFVALSLLLIPSVHAAHVVVSLNRGSVAAPKRVALLEEQA